MNLAPQDIERIVREVLKRVLAEGTWDAGDESATARINGQPVGRSGNHELELGGKVISLSQIEGKLDGVRCVTARPNAVVTPSVRDYLRQHDVELVLRMPDERQQSPGPLWLATFSTRFDTQGLCDDLKQRGLSCRVLTERSLPAIVAQLARQLDGRATAVLLTNATEVAVCAVNRHKSIRGFVANDVATLTKARRATGGNLLIADPANCSGADICEMGCGMANHAPVVPPLWQGVL